MDICWIKSHQLLKTSITIITGLKHLTSNVRYIRHLKQRYCTMSEQRMKMIEQRIKEKKLGQALKRLNRKQCKE